MKSVTLRNGVEVPIIGYGVYQITDNVQCKQCVLDALSCGYRLIDTAAAYFNEEAVGAAIKESGIPREEIFITTKIWVQDFGYENTLKAFETSLKKLGVDYIDLLLLHQPFNDYYGSWRALEELYDAKKVRAIGVSNFYPDRLADLCLNCRIRPFVNQVENHPFFQRKDDIKVAEEYGVKVESWGPLARTSYGILDNEVLKSIAKHHNKSIAQICFRWNIQRGIIIIPKSVHKDRIKENIDIFDFELTNEEMESISKLDQGKSSIRKHFDPEFVKMINGYKIH